MEVLKIIQNIVDDPNITNDEKVETLKFLLKYNTDKELKRERVAKQRNAFLQLQLRNSKSITAKRKTSYFVQYKEKTFESDKQPKLMPGVFDCGTDNFEEALSKAIRYRETWLAEYHQRQMEKEKIELFKILLSFYQPGSYYLKRFEIITHKKLNEENRLRYKMYVEQIFVPYFKTHKNQDGLVFDTFSRIKEQDLLELRTWIITEYKNWKGQSLSPKTTKIVMTALRNIFSTMFYDRLITSNPFDHFNVPMNIGEEVRNIHRAFDAADYKKMFKMKWDNEFYYMLCLIAFNTGCRNSEILNIRLDDIDIDCNYYYIHIRGTKTKAADRKVPINRFTYLKIMDYCKRNGLSEKIFDIDTEKKQISWIFQQCMKYVGELLGYSQEQMKENGYTFYGFRRFYSTLLHGSNLDYLLVEYLMGHSNGTVAERYTEFSVLDGMIFKPIVEKFDEYVGYVSEQS